MTEIANLEVRLQFSSFCTKLEKKLKKAKVDNCSNKIQQILIDNRKLKSDYDNLKDRIVDLERYTPKQDTVEATAFNVLFEEELNFLRAEVARAKENNDFGIVEDLFIDCVANDKLYLLDTLLHSISDEWTMKLLQDNIWGEGPVLQWAVHSSKKDLCELLLQTAEEKGKAKDVLLAVACKFDKERQDNDFFTAMRYAVEKGDHDVCKLFLQVAERNGCTMDLLLQRAIFGFTPLFGALDRYDREMCKVFLQAAHKENRAMDLIQAKYILAKTSESMEFIGKEITKIFLEYAKKEKRLKDLLEQPEDNLNLLHNAICLNDVELCRLILQTAESEGHLLDTLSSRFLDITALPVAILCGDKAISDLFLQAAGEHKAELMMNENPLMMKFVYTYLIENPALIKSELARVVAQNKNEGDDWQKEVKEIIDATLKKIAGKPSQSALAEACDVLFLLLNMPKDDHPNKEQVEARKAILTQIRKIMPLEQRLIALTDLVRFCREQANAIARYENLYSTIKAESKDRKQLEALSPCFCMLLNRYQDAKALELARDFVQNCSMSSLQSGLFCGMLANSFSVLDESEIDDKQSLLKLMINYATNAKTFSSMLVFLRSVNILNANDILDQLLKMFPQFVKEAEEVVHKAEEYQKQCATKEAEFKKEHKEELEAFKEKRAEFGKLKKEMLTKKVAIEKMEKILSKEPSNEETQKKLEMLKDQYKELERAFQHKRDNFKKPQAILNLEEADSKLKAAQDELKKTKTPDTIEMLQELLRVKSQGLIDNQLIDDVSAYFSGSRYPSAPIIYFCNLLGLSGEKRDHAMADFAMWVRSLNNFRDFRYDHNNNPLLNKIHQLDPTLVGKWSSLTTDKGFLEELNKRQFSAIKGQEITPKDILKHALIDDTLLPADQCKWVIRYLKAEPEEQSEVLAGLKSALESSDSASMNMLVAQQHMISLLMPMEKDQVPAALTKMSAIPNLLQLSTSDDFIQSLEELKKVLLPAEEMDTSSLTLTLTDDPVDILLAGTEIPGSCQRIDGDPNKNRGVLSYLTNGGIIPLGHKDAQGRWVSRALLRLAYVKDDTGGQRPVLLFERIYPASANKKMSDELRSGAAFIANRLGIDAISADVVQENKGVDVEGHVFIDKGPAYAEYVDAAKDSGVIEGDKWPCAIRQCVYLSRTSPITPKKTSPVVTKKREGMEREYKEYALQGKKKLSRDQRKVIRAIKRIHKSVGGHWSDHNEMSIERYEQDINRSVFAVSKDEEIIGYATARKDSDKEYYLSYIVVDQNKQSSGVGRNMLLRILEKVKKKGGEVVRLECEDTEKLRKFYTDDRIPYKKTVRSAGTYRRGTPKLEIVYDLTS